jgi:hypothetical protein
LLVAGSIVFRVVTPLTPGDSSLDAIGAPSIRTEYLATGCEPWVWVLERKEAFRFPSHLAAEEAGATIGPRCHARVVESYEDEPQRVPERLQPRPESAPMMPERRRAPAKKAGRIDPFREAQCRRDPVEGD